MTYEKKSNISKEMEKELYSQDFMKIYNECWEKLTKILNIEGLEAPKVKILEEKDFYKVCKKSAVACYSNPQKCVIIHAFLLDYPDYLKNAIIHEQMHYLFKIITKLDFYHLIEQYRNIEEFLAELIASLLSPVGNLSGYTCFRQVFPENSHYYLPCLPEKMNRETSPYDYANVLAYLLKEFGEEEKGFELIKEILKDLKNVKEKPLDKIIKLAAKIKNVVAETGIKILSIVPDKYLEEDNGFYHVLYFLPFLVSGLFVLIDESLKSIVNKFLNKTTYYKLGEEILNKIIGTFQNYLKKFYSLPKVKESVEGILIYAERLAKEGNYYDALEILKNIERYIRPYTKGINKELDFLIEKQKVKIFREYILNTLPLSELIDKILSSSLLAEKDKYYITRFSENLERIEKYAKELGVNVLQVILDLKKIIETKSIIDIKKYKKELYSEIISWINKISP